MKDYEGAMLRQADRQTPADNFVEGTGDKLLPSGVRCFFGYIDPTLTEEQIADWFTNEIGIPVTADRISLSRTINYLDNLHKYARSIMVSFPSDTLTNLVVWLINGRMLGNGIPNVLPPRK